MNLMASVAPPARHAPRPAHALPATPAFSTRAADDAVDVLMAGQLAARELISRYERLQHSPGFGPVARQALAHKLCSELAVHLQLEEEIFYPALREDMGPHRAIDLAEVEHECLRGLLQQVARMRPEQPLFDARVAVMGELFDIHLHRELSELYPLARQSALNLGWLGMVLAARRDELLAQAAAGERVGG